MENAIALILCFRGWNTEIPNGRKDENILMIKIQPDPYHILLDSRFANEEVQNTPHTYNNIREALSDRALSGASREQPVTVYIAPGVYWLEDPQSDAVITREDPEDLYPYGCKVNCGNLRLVGMSENPADVVIAANRGNDHGAKGNYTLLHFSGERLEMENLTLGNYCCVDLDYTRDPALSVKKRTETITQAQLADTNADKFHAKNCRFVSRLNLYPVCGAGRSLYEHCHFEQTDDALNGNAVYLDCEFDFYSGMPIYQASGTGAVFLNCTFHCKYPQDGKTHAQYFTKVGGQIALIDSNFVSLPDTKAAVSWTKYPSIALRCYQANVTYPKAQFVLSEAAVPHTVDIAGKTLTDAYFITKDGEKLYNVYNLLGGKDNWDPLGNGEVIRLAGKTDIPTQLLLESETFELEAGGSPINIKGKCLTFDGREVKREIHFKIEGDSADSIEIQRVSEGSYLLQLKDSNIDHETVVILTAQTEEGLQTGAYVRIHPRKVPAPTFTGDPVICREGKMLRISYRFAEEVRDCSDITWYRSKDIRGEEKILTAISQPDRPEKTYILTGDDAGYFISAQIRPGTDRSECGEAVQIFYEKMISPEEVETDRIQTDFHNIPLYTYAGNKKGVWNFDAKRPEDTYDFEKWGRERTAVSWHYGVTGDGSKGEGLYQGMQGARIRYTPTLTTEIGAETKRNMEVLLEADPAKSAGQGFGSAGQYLDLCIKMDTDTLNGYGLRIIRTSAHSDAVSMYLIKYINGQAQAISQEIVTSCFVTGCRIRVRYENGILSAKAWTVTEPTAAQREKGYARAAELTAEVNNSENAENTEHTEHNGLLLWHTGSLGTENWRNTTMLHAVSIRYF